jgi:predicted TPR repeat methyltransferase
MSAETIERTVSLEDAVSLAIEWLKIDRFDDAALLFDRILQARPDHARALHFAGVLAQQQRRTGDAVALIERSLALEPDVADWHSNFAVVLIEAGNAERALAECRRAIALAPDHVNAHNNLGALFRARGQHEESEAAYRAALSIDPHHADALVNLGNALGRRGRYAEAVDHYVKAIVIRPTQFGRQLLAYAYTKLGQKERAIAVYEEALRDNPDDPVALHMSAALTGRDVPARASDRFVATTFDGFAATFEAKLARLEYRAPALVAAALRDSGVAAQRTLDVLDAGCGTGLCGQLLVPFARRLIGVDLSRGMLTLARQKQVYDGLVQAELTSFLRGLAGAFDVIVSADTLVYFGPLEDVLAAAARALRPGGMLVFTVEEAGEAEAPAGVRLATHGRYGHTQAYVEAALRDAGFAPEIGRAELRLEGGEPAAGLVVRGRKQGSR